MIIAIETATDICSVACRDAKGVVHERSGIGKGVHSEKLFLFLEELREEGFWHPDGLTEMLISSGPGSYTGLRIGAAALKGLLFQRQVPLFSLGTLLSLGAGVLAERPETKRLHLVLDARRKHLYHRLLEVRDEEIIIGEAVVRPIREFEETWVREGDSVAGTGLDRLGSETRQRATLLDKPGISSLHLIHARSDPRFAHLFVREDVELFEPNYLTMGQTGR
ncbi:MAG: tRNA (adenosine(37)-N6)-threonylcarbamoyltransferase complex dimerization subunit type 1 TsaB [Balneolaceae bacterium]